MNEEDTAATSLDDFNSFQAGDIAANESLIIALEGFEGPLDLLLALARNQKVDIAKISVLQLADQYLAFVESVRSQRLELAADYLVMAAWLTYLKSRLVLPRAAAPEDAGAEELAAQLRWRLARLQAMREASVRLLARNRLGRDVFARGKPEPVVVTRTRKQSDTLYDLLTAYSQQRVKQLGHRVYKTTPSHVYLIEEARLRIERMLGQISNWSALQRFLPPEWATGPRRRSALASTFLAALEMTRDGRLEMRQMTPWGDIFLKNCAPLDAQDAAWEAAL